MNWLDAVIGASEVVSSNWPPPKPKPLWTPGQPSVDIVVPHRSDLILRSVNGSKPVSSGLMITLMSCEEALKESNFDYKYIVVANGVAGDGQEREALNGAKAFLDKTGRGTVFRNACKFAPGS
jgi:hypothetical protein